jgi:hypothetical protein
METEVEMEQPQACTHSAVEEKELLVVVVVVVVVY